MTRGQVEAFMYLLVWIVLDVLVVGVCSYVLVGVWVVYRQYVRYVQAGGINEEQA